MTSEAKPSRKETPVVGADERQAVTPYLAVKNATAALEFYKQAFGAIELMRIAQPDGRIGHAEIKIGRGQLMMADEFPEIGVVSPSSLGGSAVAIHVYVDDVDSLASQAVAAGAKLLKPVQDQFYGDRTCTLEDPFGHRWYFATHKEDMTTEEMQRRAAAVHGQD
ncbi:MAG TPA: VOC family protein [Blastocatellia bacterium]|nr:VOC family protein [Blastocatellia bacterium]